MKKLKDSKSQKNEKREAVFDVALDVFAQYGFRRTAMNDIARAACISRPALYLMFENKEALFRELVSFRQNQGENIAISILSRSEPITERLPAAILAYEKIFYEPVAQSPHGAELIDISFSAAADLMKKGQERLERSLAQALEEAESNGEISFTAISMQPITFVCLLMASIGGLKKHATSSKAFRRQISEVVEIFLISVNAAPAKPVSVK